MRLFEPFLLSVKSQLRSALDESFIALTVATERDTQFERWTEDDSRSGEKCLRELEFNDLNIHLYLTLIYERIQNTWTLTLGCFITFFVFSWSSTITQNSIRKISDLDRSRMTDTRSAEDSSIGDDTDYQIDASLDLLCFTGALWRVHIKQHTRHPLQLMKGENSW